MSSIPPLPDIDHDPLWDPRAPGDPSIAALEAELRPLRYDRPAPDFTAIEPQARRPSWVRWGTIAAAAAAALAVGWLVGGAGPAATVPTAQTPLAAPSTIALDTPSARPSAVADGAPAAADGWRLDVIGGAPTCDGTVVDGTTRLQPGVWLDTQDDARARLAIADFGSAEVGPGVRLRVEATTAEQTVVELARGMIEVSVEAAPERFVLKTPFGRVVDLGCRYTVEVQPARLLLEVSVGAVALRRDGDEVRVEAGERLIATPSSLGSPTHEDVWQAPEPSSSTTWGAPPTR